MGLGPLSLLEAIRIFNPAIRFYQVSTSETFGQVQEVQQTERTPLSAWSLWRGEAMRPLDDHQLPGKLWDFGASGILFNHELPLRGQEFVTRKITDAVARIKLEKFDVLELGNLDAKRNWVFAQEYFGSSRRS